MAALSLSIDAIRPLNRWADSRIQPGSVGSVGDVNLTPRFCQSAPDLPMRYDPYFRGKKESRLGSNVQNGTQKSFDSRGMGPITVDSNWGGRRNFKVNRGWVYQDMRVPDKRVEPIMGSTPNYSYQNKLATVYEAKTRGEKFLPLPGGYIPSPGELTRGGTYPFVRNLEPGTELPSRTIAESTNPMVSPQTIIAEEALQKRGLMAGGLGSGKPNKRMK